MKQLKKDAQQEVKQFETQIRSDPDIATLFEQFASLPGELQLTPKNSAQYKSLFARLEAARKSIRQLIQSKYGDQKFENPVLTVILTPSFEAALGAVARARTQIAGTMTVIAVRRFQLKNGRWPSSLDELDKATEVAIDMNDQYSGSRLKYTIVNGKPLIYSIGDDQTDQSGKVEWSFARGEPGDMIFRLP